MMSTRSKYRKIKLPPEPYDVNVIKVKKMTQASQMIRAALKKFEEDIKFILIVGESSSTCKILIVSEVIMNRIPRLHKVLLIIKLLDS